MNRLFYFLLFFITSTAVLQASQYRLNEEKIDQMFNQAEEQLTLSFSLNPVDFSLETSSVRVGEKDPWVAFALSMVFYVTGISGIHRLYLGAGPAVFIAYLLTGGGCGIIQLVDSVVLFIGAVEDDISQYVDNRKLFMW